MVTFYIIVMYLAPAVSIIGVTMYGIACFDRSNKERIEALREWNSPPKYC